MTNFNQMNIADHIKTALRDMGFSQPTPIQCEVIPLMLDGRDVVAQAPTGTGKTCAFGIPVIENIDTNAQEIQALILCPTRELVIQTENELKAVAKHHKLIRLVSIYGGQNIDKQLAQLRKKPQIVIGTTGRVMDHLRRKTLKLGSLRMLVLDEVDEMLDMGFKEDIDVILKTVPSTRQTVLFSATMPKEILRISKDYQIDPISVKTEHKGNDIPSINQYYVAVEESQKVNTLISIMNQKNYRLALVFCNTKRRVDQLCARLNELGFSADALHGDLRQRNRDKTMQRFRGGHTRMLIATDVAARGIDVDGIEVVFNFDVPCDEEYYVHRIGRTARANKLGDAYTFVLNKQMFAIRSFERYTKHPILRASFDAQGETNESAIDKKLFERTLKLAKRGDLAQYKDFLTSELFSLKQKFESAEMVDIAAALLVQVNDFGRSGFDDALEQSNAKGIQRKGRGRGKKGEALGEIESEAEPNEKLKQSTRESAKRGAQKEPIEAYARDDSRIKSKKGVKFFMNVGTLDKCDPEQIAKFIGEKVGIDREGIIKVDCLENFSFVTVNENSCELMDLLNGLKINRRLLSVEIAGKAAKTKKQTFVQRVNEKKVDFKAKNPKDKKTRDVNKNRPSHKNNKSWGKKK